MSKDCIFCKIVAGTVPSAKVYEDGDTLAFMDIGPVVKGHTLVIPKQHHVDMASTPPELLQKVVVTVRRVVRAQKQALGADGINVAQANGELAGQVVPHIHFHIIPRFKDTGPATDQRNWRPGKYDSSDEMKLYAEKLRKAID